MKKWWGKLASKKKEKQELQEVREKEYKLTIQEMRTLDVDILEFQWERSHNAYVLELDQLKNLKEMARFQLGAVGVIGTLGITMFFTLMSMNLFSLSGLSSEGFSVMGTIFIFEIILLLAPSYLLHDFIDFISTDIVTMPNGHFPVNDTKTSKKDILISDILSYKSITDLAVKHGDRPAKRLQDNQTALYYFIISTIMSISFLFETSMHVFLPENSFLLTKIPVYVPFSLPCGFSLTICITLFLQLIPIYYIVFAAIRRVIRRRKNMVKS
jgi:hypothetical protein